MINKIMGMKLFRPITLSIFCVFLITYIIIAYVFDLEI